LKTILFVCTGNTCRSSMAEALMKKLLEDAGGNIHGIRVLSAGTSAMKGERAARSAIQVMQEKNIDIRGHQATPLTKELIQKSDLILTMTRNHKSQVLLMEPRAEDKTYTLKEYASKLGSYGEISDEIDKLLRLIDRKKVDFFKAYEEEISSLRNQRYELMSKLQQVDDRIKELEIKMAQTVANEQREVVYLQDKLPSVDISDPFGQPLGIYRECAKELEEELKVILFKLTKDLDK